MSYVLGKRSRDNLRGVDPKLVKIVDLAITMTSRDFTVIEGIRTIERQRQLFDSGFSKTMRSHHLTGHAVDIVPYPIARGLDYPHGHWQDVADAMFAAAKKLRVKGLQWGWAEWGWDKPHWQLPPRK